MTKASLIFSISLLLSCVSFAASPQTIYLNPEASDLEQYAAKELQRYLYHLSRELLPISQSDKITTPGFLIATLENKSIRDILSNTPAPGEQGYILKTLDLDQNKILLITSPEPIGCLYGVYGLLEDHFNVSFYFSGDVFPTEKTVLQIPTLNETITPAVHIRGVLPWTNFPQSATSYSIEDWKFVIDQMARMRMNLLNIHNYFGFGTTEEMFHNFILDDQIARVWFATAATGHVWGGQPGWDVNKYQFGAADLFDDYDFGSDSALHNENLDNYNTFRKGVSLFQQVINYAHKRGVKIALGIEFGIIPQSYGQIKPEDPKIIQARCSQIIHDYPDLDYLICYQFENPELEAIRLWLDSFNQVYALMKQNAPQIKLAVSGWGLTAQQVIDVPQDVIVAPIAHYSPGCESGEIYGDREYWGCPWLETDGLSSMYYYPYAQPLQSTIDSWLNRHENMKGFQCLTWRLTDGVDAKTKYIADAPWHDRFKTSQQVYHEYASENYGTKSADLLTTIIDNNEPFASDWGECQFTPPFEDPAANAKNVLNIYAFSFAEGITPENRINADSYTAKNGTQNAPCSEGGQCIGYIDSGNWLKFENIRFENTGKFTARIAAIADGGQISIHLDDPNSQPIGTVNAVNTNDWQKWTNVTGPINPTEGTHDVYLKFGTVSRSTTELRKAQKQLEIIDQCISIAQSPEQKRRLEKLRMRIAAARDHIILNTKFQKYNFADLPGQMPSWEQNFIYRVDDISSLGTVVSTQNRYVQINYMLKVKALRNTLHQQNNLSSLLQPPSNVQARGTTEGSVITWTNELLAARGFNIYRNDLKINDQPLPSYTRTFKDKADGSFNYYVTALTWNDIETQKSIPAACSAGSADNQPPHIVLISPPTSAAKGQPFEIKARLLDNRTHQNITADLHYRAPGQPKWQTLTMTRKVKAIFTASLPTDKFDILEYYISASDGTSTSTLPVSAPAQTLSTVISKTETAANLEKPKLKAENKTLTWQTNNKTTHLYRIYRSRNKNFKTAPHTFLTYLAAVTESYKETGVDLLGQPLQGNWYYRITAVDIEGFESKPSNTVKIEW